MSTPYLDKNGLTHLVEKIKLKANSASPALTGTPTAPTAPSGTSTTQIATTEFVMNELGDIERLLESV